MQKIAIPTRACRQTVTGLFLFFVDHGAGIRRATYLYLDCAKNVDKNWNKTVSFIIHVNFDHVWAEHYPVTLMLTCIVHSALKGPDSWMPICKHFFILLIYNEKYFSDIVHVLTWRAQKMRSPTCSEDSLLVRIVVPCAQTSLPGPRGHRDAFSSLSERRKHRALRQACSACHQALSEAREVMSAICHGMVVDSMFKQTSP